jgi:ribosome recycling factor
MKLIKIACVAAFAVLGASTALAEEYDGVLVVQSTRARADVKAEAVASSSGINPYADGALAGVPVPVASERSRESVYKEALEATAASNQNVKNESRVNSIVRHDVAARSWGIESHPTQSPSSTAIRRSAASGDVS